MQWSVDVDERDIGSVPSTHCFTILFADFGQVIGSLEAVTMQRHPFFDKASSFL